MTEETIPFLLKTETIINNLNCSQELKDIALSLVNDKRFVDNLYLIDKINYHDNSFGKIKYHDNSFGKVIVIVMNKDDNDIIWVDIHVSENKLILVSRLANPIEYSNIEELLSAKTEDFRTDEIALSDRIKNDLAERIEENVYSLVEDDHFLKRRWDQFLGAFYKCYYKWFFNSEHSISGKSLYIKSKCKPLTLIITEYEFPIIIVIYNDKIIFDDYIWSNNNWDIKLDKLFTKISNDTI